MFVVICVRVFAPWGSMLFGNVSPHAPTTFLRAAPSLPCVPSVGGAGEAVQAVESHDRAMIAWRVHSRP